MNTYLPRPLSAFSSVPFRKRISLTIQSLLSSGFLISPALGLTLSACGDDGEFANDNTSSGTAEDTDTDSAPSSVEESTSSSTDSQSTTASSTTTNSSTNGSSTTVGDTDESESGSSTSAESGTDTNTESATGTETDSGTSTDTTATETGTDDSGETGTSTGTGTDTDTEDTEDTDSDDTLQWKDCPKGFLGKCARLNVPIDWSYLDSSREIELMVARKSGKGDEPRAQLWMLAGGPGGSGTDLSQAVNKLGELRPEFDIYVLEHRGVGESTRLTCPKAESKDSPGGFSITPDEWPDCIDYLNQEWGQDLHQFTTSNAARDLEHVIDRLREDDQKVFVYGQSYGTMLAMRLLQVAHEDTEIDGVILDSVLAPGVIFSENYDSQIDPVAQDLGSLCANDSTCKDKLGDKPWEKVVDLVESLDSGHCEALEMDSNAFGGLAAILVFGEPLRKFLYPAAYRLDRCDEADVEALSKMFEYLKNLWGEPKELPKFSQILMNNILYAEISHIPAEPLKDIQARCDSLTLCPGVSTNWHTNYGIWPRYLPDEHGGKWPKFEVPVLAVNGELDPQTPIAAADNIKEHLKGDDKNYFAFPYSPHIIVTRTPVKDMAAPHCGAQMMSDFLEKPMVPPSDACQAELVPVDFEPEDKLVEEVFGSKELWENSRPRLSTPRRIPNREDWGRLIRRAVQSGYRLNH